MPELHARLLTKIGRLVATNARELVRGFVAFFRYLPRNVDHLTWAMSESIWRVLR